MIAIVINTYWITVLEVRWYSLDGSCLPIFITPVFILFVLILLNHLLTLLIPRYALSPSELIVSYAMVFISETLSGHDMLQNLFGQINHAFWFDSPSNRWKELFLDYIPGWLAVTDRAALTGYYQGDGSPFSWLIIRSWLVPLTVWGFFVILLGIWMISFAGIIRKRWMEHEKLVYPIVQLPAMMVQPQAVRRLYLSKPFLAGFLLAGLIALMNGLNELYPQFPSFSRYIKLHDMRQYITERPWSAANPFQISLYPFAIGLAYFLPLDLSFSCWFFFVLRLAEQILGAVFGWEQIPGFPFFGQQASGAWLILGWLALWSSRGWLLYTLSPRAQDRDEPIPFRFAHLSLLVTTILLALFTWAMGMGALTMVVFWIVFYTFSIAITRVRAELGAPHEIVYAQPRNILADLFGTARFTPRELTAISLTHWFNRGYLCHPMPGMLETFKFAQIFQINQRPMAVLVFLTYLLSIPISYWANLVVCYREGATARCIGFKAWVGWEAFNQLASWLQAPQQILNPRRIAMAVGALIVWGLWSVRQVVSSLPFHHAGYALAVSYAMNYFWFAFMISWLLKALILKFGGITAHSDLMPFFVGLIVGDFTAGSIWGIIGPVRGFRNYRIYIF
ncbi:MAG: hypothetical protein NZ959_02585 [Armatimonadetes bacterium]|nr:hypothetical protein [Armatimonadota bacterium]